jgi:hypothetical protein
MVEHVRETVPSEVRDRLLAAVLADAETVLDEAGIHSDLVDRLELLDEILDEYADWLAADRSERLH